MRDIILNNFAKIKLWFKGSKEQSIDSRQELENDREKRICKKTKCKTSKFYSLWYSSRSIFSKYFYKFYLFKF